LKNLKSSATLLEEPQIPYFYVHIIKIFLNTKLQRKMAKAVKLLTYCGSKWVPILVEMADPRLSVVLLCPSNKTPGQCLI